jgi:hypothetical protein
MLLLILVLDNWPQTVGSQIAPLTELGVDDLQDSLCRTPYNAKRNGQTIRAVKDDDFAS